MSKLQVFENELFKVLAKREGDQVLFDAEEVARSLGFVSRTDKNGVTYENVRWSRVNSFLPQVAEIKSGDLIPEPLVYKLAFKAQNEIAEKFQDWLAIEVIPTIRKTGSYGGLDTSQLSPELQIMNNMVKSLAKQEMESREIKQEQKTIKHRLDNMDSLDTIGDLQQRLNAMVRRYAQDSGISFGNAWRDFRNAFNVAYRTNLKLLMNNYKSKHNLKSLTMPNYLSLVDRLPDAIRVADKMLNKELV